MRLHQADLFLTPELLTIIGGYLGVTDPNTAPEQIRVDSEGLFGDAVSEEDHEEFWSPSLPTDVDVVLYMNDVFSKKHAFTWGEMKFCTWRGKKFVYQECAGPLLLFWVE